MTVIALTGLLALDPLRAVVLGRHQLLKGGELGDPSPQDIENLNHYVEAMTGSLPQNGTGLHVAASSLADPVLCAWAQEIMDLKGQVPAQVLFARKGALAVRAASRVRAETLAGKVHLRHAAQPGDVRTVALRQPYAKFFAVEERDVAWRRFDGTFGAPVTRAAFVSGDAVTVLPYDPLRDRVLVVEQFRAGPQARGDAQAWQLEAIAGRIDPGETPEQAALREAQEEAGLALTTLLPVAAYYPSPGILSEFLYSYVATTDLPDGIAGVFGLESEQEDIRGHLLGFDALMALVASGEVSNAPLILTAFWLDRHRADLRAAAQKGGGAPPSG